MFLSLCFCLQEVQKDLHTKGEGIAEAIRSVEELLSEQGETLSPEERENLQAALTRMKEQYSALTDSTSTTLSELDTAINNTVQQNTQRVRAAMWSYICQNFKSPLVKTTIFTHF